MRLTYVDQINLAKCAQQRYRDSALSGDYKRAHREGLTVATWTRMAADLFDIYHRIAFD